MLKTIILFLFKRFKPWLLWEIILGFLEIKLGWKIFLSLSLVSVMIIAAFILLKG